MYEQQEYLLAYALVFAFLILGMLVVCIPRPRKKGFVEPEEAAKEKRIKLGQKTQNKTRKQQAKLKKKKAKAHARKIKKRTQ
jgi:hypothetical protein